MTTIKLKNGSGAPTSGDLVQGEPALDLTNKRLYTEDSGGTVIEVGTNPTSITTGDITATGTASFANLATTGNITFGDNDKAVFGAGSDLQIYHSGSHSFISEAGTGDLYIGASSNIALMNSAFSENKLLATTDGALKLYYDGSQKLATTATGIDVTGSVVSDGLTVDGATALNNTSAGTTVATLSGQYAGSGDVKLLAFQRNGGAVAGAITYADASTGMEIGTTTSHTLALTTGDTQRLRIGNGGDISFYEDTGTTASLVYTAASTSLKLTGREASRSNNTYALEVDNSAQGSNMSAAGAFNVKGYYGNQLTVNGLGDVSFYDDSGTAKLFWDASAESLGIGTSSVSNKLSIDVTNTNTGTPFDSTSVGVIALQNTSTTANTSTAISNKNPSSDSANSYIQFINEDGAFKSSIAFGTATAGASNFGERMRIDSSGNVGIGTNSPAFTTGSGLEIERAGAATLRLEDTGSSGKPFEIYSDDGEGYVVNGIGSGMPMIFKTVNTERMRIDSSGNVLVGKTSAAIAGAGTAILSSGTHNVTVDGDTTLQLNRLSSNGAIATFFKDSITVGSIGCDSNSNFMLGQGDTGLSFQPSSDRIIPRNTDGSGRDGFIDLGGTGNRFKDLYLSGDVIAPNIVASNGVFLGGTSNANKLDDYEEGTWTPVYSPATAFTSITYDSATGGTYTKVGNVVHIRGAVRTDAINGGSGQVKIGGLPFTSNSVAPLGTFSIGYLNNFSGDFPGGIYVNGGATTAGIVFRTGANTGLDNDLQVSDLNTGGNANYILFSGSYYVA